MNSLGIRAEDKNIWEKRVPLVPEHLDVILRNNSFPVYVESPSVRLFSDRDYEKIGCSITGNISQADIIVGVKEIPIEKIYDNKVYVYFSHTIKAQKPNLPMLRKIIDSGSTLIDYERIVDEQNRRLLFFGHYAGTAGAIDMLWLTGREWKRLGISSPLSRMKQAFNYPTVDQAKREIAEIAKLVSKGGWPNHFAPMVVGFFGYGNVSRGAQEIMKIFPHRYIEPGELLNLKSSGLWSHNTLYLCVLHEEHMVRNRYGKKFDLQHYYNHPEDFLPVTDQYSPLFTILVNAVFWNKQYPHFFTRQIAKYLYQLQAEPRFYGIADLSCDIEGGVEITVKTTESGQPAFKYCPTTDSFNDDMNSEGIIVLAVDNLPGELAYDASYFFSNLFKEFIPSLVHADFSQPLSETGLDPALQRAVIVHNGTLTTDYMYLEEYVRNI